MWPSHDPIVIHQGGAEGVDSWTCPSSIPPFSTGAPYWLNPTGSWRSRAPVVHGAQPLGTQSRMGKDRGWFREANGRYSALLVREGASGQFRAAWRRGPCLDPMPLTLNLVERVGSIVTGTPKAPLRDFYWVSQGLSLNNKLFAIHINVWFLTK